MNAESNADWRLANQRYLMAAIKVVQQELESYRLSRDGDRNEDSIKEKNSAAAQTELENAAADLDTPAPIDNIVNVLGLSTFERKILLMCAGVELDTQFCLLISALQGNPSFVHPSFSLALAALHDAHWSAISPSSSLRYWHLVEMQQGELLTKSALKIDEHILHYITGVHYLDDRLKDNTVPVFPDSSLVPSQKELAEKIVFACASHNAVVVMPVIQLSGNNKQDKPAIAATACATLGYNLYSLDVFLVPGHAKELAELVRLWNREAALNSCALFLDCSKLDLNDKLRVELVISFVENIQGILIVSVEEWVPQLKRAKIDFTVSKPTWNEQLQLWKNRLGTTVTGLEQHLENVVSHFSLSSKTINLSCQEVLAQQEISNREGADSTPISNLIWKSCCIHTRLSIDELAHRIKPVAGWDDLVLPEAQKRILREIAAQVKHRNKVYKEWGFAGMGSRGLGISALFSGESGTGKTMAAEVLANELQLDLYRIDLSQVVNKYIGETEKNLKRIFDSAEEGGAILLFDEADALFGKRSDVKDSHDRYSNIEVSYLLQRMESYGGLAVLTTNLKNAIDKAFLRRIRFVVQFPYPDVLHRAEIWRRIFPANTPVRDLDIAILSSMSVPGGNIRNIAINAAFMAAAEGQPVQMHHVSRAARTEYAKLDKSVNTIEIGLS